MLHALTHPKTLLFRVLPESGHMNATFGLARALRDRGHRVVYASVEDFQESIENQGFEFHRLEEELIWAGKTRFAAKPIRNPLEWLCMERARRAWGRQKHKEMMAAEAFLTEIEATKPHLVLVDSPFVRFTPTIANTGTPFLILESMVALDFSPTAPPLNSYYVPSNSILSRARCQLTWATYFAVRRIRQLFDFPTMVSKRTMNELCAKTGFPADSLNYRRYFHPAVANAPEVFLSPREFDFPRTPKQNQFYARAGAARARAETNYDYRFDAVWGQIDRRRTNDSTHKLVYCSLGGMSFRYQGIGEFFERVIAACRNLPATDLILSIGNELSIHRFEPVPDNVHLFRRVPQLKLLKRTDLMITHGGMNSIMECVLAGVPMLVYPGSDKIDQPGNAARVAYHGMGLTGKLRRDSVAQIASKALQLLNTPAYAANTQRMRTRILDNSGPEAIASTVGTILGFASTDREHPVPKPTQQASCVD